MNDPATLDALRFFAFGIGCALLILGAVTLDKWGLLSRPAFLPEGFWVLGLLLFGFYAFTFSGTGEPLRPHPEGFLAFAVPLLLIFALPAIRAVKVYLKETRLYQTTFIEGEGRETGRWGGLLAYIRHDISAWFRASKDRIVSAPQSPLYLGRTLPHYDFRLGRRDIGLTSEQHMLTVAGSGAGKSRDAISNNLLAWNGGVVGFDMKAEHTRLCHERRRAYAPFHVIDPWNLNRCGLTSATWNPLSEIDINDPTARSRLKRLSEAVIMAEGNVERAVDVHFREVPQKIFRGYMAHVLSRYPVEQQHLGTVYDLLVRGDSNNAAFNPNAVEQVILDMAKNDACGGAPAEAAAVLSTLEGSEKSGVHSTLSRSLDWINDLKVREIITKPSTFSLRDCKTRNASVFLIIPKIFLPQQHRFLRVFYQSAFDLLDEHETPQPKGSKRRVLFLFDEFEALGNFPPARAAVLRDRSSFLKCWFILQTLGQLKVYSNPADFTANCDKQFFGIDRSDRDAVEMISAALGSYTVEERDAQGNIRRDTRKITPESDLAKILNAGTDEQIVIPVSGHPMKLRRVPVFRNFGGRFRASLGLRDDEIPKASTPPLPARAAPRPEPANTRAPSVVVPTATAQPEAKPESDGYPQTARALDDTTRPAFARWRHFGLAEGFTAPQVEAVYYANIGKIAVSLVEQFNADYAALTDAATPNPATPPRLPA